MENKTTYTCECCGQVHEGWPALAYDSPSNYNELSVEERNSIAELSEDFCMIRHTDQTDRFIRVMLSLKVNDYCETLDYGLWVSLSEKSYEDYSENFNSENHEVTYFGWLCNHISGYERSTMGIPTTVYTRTGNQRPEIVPHESFEHPFVRDYFNGITKVEAERRIETMLNLKKTVAIKKSWWKFW